MTDTPYSVPKEPGRWRAIALAVAVHAVLVIFLWIGINWQSHPPEEVQAEIWSEQARDAAPTAPEPEPTPQPKPEPAPVVRAPPKIEPDVPPPPKVDIALEQEKKRKKLEKLQQQQAEQERQDKLKKQKTDQDRLDKEKLAQQKKADQQKQAALDKQALDKKRKQDTADTQLQKKIRDEEMRRLTGAVGSGGSGEAAKTQGSGRATDPSYADKIRAKIRMNTTFPVPDGLNGNPAAEYAVELLPDGSVRSISLSKSSGLPGFDEAVKRAIDRSQPFPPDKTGRVPTSITISSKPKDQ